MKKVKLYYAPYCPYCKKVLNHMEKEGIEFECLDTSEDVQNKEDLIRIGGKHQIPCLVIDGVALYESDDIIKWLDEHRGEYK